MQQFKNTTLGREPVSIIYYSRTGPSIKWPNLIKRLNQGLVKGAELCLNPYFLAGWRSELAGCRSTLSMSKIKVRISETKYRSFYKTLGRMVLT